MSRKKDQIGISYPRMTLIGILDFEKGTKLEYSDPNWNSWGWKARIGISPLKKLTFATPKELMTITVHVRPTYG